MNNSTNGFTPIYYFTIFDKLITNHKKMAKNLSKVVWKYRFFNIGMCLFSITLYFGAGMLLTYLISTLFVPNLMMSSRIFISLIFAGVMFLLCCGDMVYHCRSHKLKEIDDKNIKLKDINFDDELKEKDINPKSADGTFSKYLLSVSKQISDILNLNAKTHNVLISIEDKIKEMFVIMFMGFDLQSNIDEIDSFVEKNSPNAFIDLYYIAKAQLKRIHKFMIATSESDLEKMNVSDCAMFMILSEHAAINSDEYGSIMDKLKCNENEFIDPTELFKNKSIELINNNKKEYVECFKYYTKTLKYIPS